MSIGPRITRYTQSPRKRYNATPATLTKRPVCGTSDSMTVKMKREERKRTSEVADGEGSGVSTPMRSIDTRSIYKFEQKQNPQTLYPSLNPSLSCPFNVQVLPSISKPSLQPLRSNLQTPNPKPQPSATQTSTFSLLLLLVFRAPLPFHPFLPPPPAVPSPPLPHPIYP